jgi:hypothetical protein
MNPDMKGSAAFIGVKDSSAQLLKALRRAYAERLSGRDGEGGAEQDPATPGPGEAAKRNADA